MIDLMDGSRVEAMISAGRKIVDAAIEQYKPFLVIGAYSGGDDSVVSTHFVAENYGATTLHCETSIGLPLCLAHVQSTAERFSWSLHVEQARPQGCPKTDGKGNPFDPATLPYGRWCDGDTAYEEWVLNHGFPAGGQHARMYQRLKLRPIERFQRVSRGSAPRNAPLMIVSGIRSDESAIRAGYKRDTMKEPGHGRVWVNPFYWQTVADFEAYRQEFGLPRNPVKSRIGISGECLCGAFASPGEREAVQSVDPDMGSYLDRLEARARANGFPWGWGECIPSWYADARRGQEFLFGIADGFRPMCVGCNRRSLPK